MRPEAEMPQVNADQNDDGPPLEDPSKPLSEEELEASEASRVLKWATVTDGFQSWSQVCKLC